MLNNQLNAQRVIVPLFADYGRMTEKRPNLTPLAMSMKMLRMRAGKSLKEIEPIVGVSQQAMSRWENGTATFPEGRIGLYLQSIGMDEDDLTREMTSLSGSMQQQSISLFSDNLESFDVTDESMAPWCEPGEKVWFQRGKHPRRYEGCVIELKSGEMLIRRYEREKDGFFFFHRINPEATEQILHSDVKALHRISRRGD